ncbi:uncharacterized protein LOC112039045 [Quercus suber]|uniref:uncharacterized protein LOC112039045 n=1 Tax=Quercus suber TaxID=58331 RepID=UPI0032DEFC6D
MKMGSSDFVLVGEYWVVFKAISAYFNIEDPDLMIATVKENYNLLIKFQGNKARYGYRARWTSAYVNTLHCEILSSCEQTPNWHLQHDRGLTKGDCRSNIRHLI